MSVKTKLFRKGDRITHQGHILRVVKRCQVTHPLGGKAQAWYYKCVPDGSPDTASPPDLILVDHGPQARAAD